MPRGAGAIVVVVVDCVVALDAGVEYVWLRCTYGLFFGALIVISDGVVAFSRVTSNTGVVYAGFEACLSAVIVSVALDTLVYRVQCGTADGSRMRTLVAVLALDALAVVIKTHLAGAVVGMGNPPAGNALVIGSVAVA